MSQELNRSKTRAFQNVIYPTFYKEAIAGKLITTDEKWDKCLQEAIQIKFSNALCLVTNVFFHDPVNAKEFFDKSKDYFSIRFIQKALVKI